MENSPLGCLSPELRNKIAELVLRGPQGSIGRLYGIPTVNGLTKTCRQMTNAMFWSINYFHLYLTQPGIYRSPPSPSEALETAQQLGDLLNIIGSEMVKCIRKLVVDVEPYNLKYGTSLMIFGVEAGKVRLAGAKTREESAITDVEGEAGRAPHFQPIVKALLNMGLKLREFHGHRFHQEIIIVDN